MDTAPQKFIRPFPHRPIGSLIGGIAPARWDRIFVDLCWGGWQYLSAKDMRLRIGKARSSKSDSRTDVLVRAGSPNLGSGSRPWDNVVPTVGRSAK